MSIAREGSTPPARTIFVRDGVTLGNLANSQWQMANRKAVIIEFYHLQYTVSNLPKIAKGE